VIYLLARDNKKPEEIVSTLLREELGSCMPIDIWYDGDIWIFRPFGRIDTGHSEDLDNALTEGICQGMRYIVLDLTDTSYISSSGIRAVIKAAKAVKADGGMISLCGMRDPVKEVFTLTGIIRLLPCHKAVKEAVENMRNIIPYL
jgi:anti-anti-sigma factor